MIIVDSHVHSNLHIYEPVEIVLAQMDLNSVSKTVLVQSTTTTDNSYLIDFRTKTEWLFVGKQDLRVLDKQVHFVSWQ